jgi:1-acyl-sn-glycerol-3-phosphate acyltransferase
LGMGNKLKFTVHAPIKVSDYDFNTLFQMTEQAIIADIEY